MLSIFPSHFFLPHFLSPTLSFFSHFIPLLISVNLKDLGFFSHLIIDGNFCFQCKQCWSCNSKSFLTKLCITVWFCFFLLLFIWFWVFFLLCDLWENTFRIISRFYLNVVLRVNFLYWSLYWWVHATGNKFLYKSFNQNHCALLRLCLSLAFCPSRRRLLDWTK